MAVRPASLLPVGHEEIDDGCPTGSDAVAAIAIPLLFHDWSEGGITNEMTAATSG
jgi:hypothetical protein